MIVVSAGMQKAGTGWYYNMTNDLLVAAGHEDARHVRDRYHLQPILRFHNCNVGRPLLPKLLLLAIPHLFGNTFVVKTHAGPTRSLQALLSRNVATATYIYRDPRDAALSAYNHGQRLRQEGHTHSFSRLTTVESAILAAKDWLEIWEQWLALDRILMTRYEDVLAAPSTHAWRLVDFLGLAVSRQDVTRIVDAYRADDALLHGNSNKKNTTHFDKGVVGRHRQVFTQRELALCQEHFGDYLPQMGYED
jgi:hypothetical protein